jgi:hypothetical protein
MLTTVINLSFFVTIYKDIALSTRYWVCVRVDIPNTL